MSAGSGMPAGARRSRWGGGRHAGARVVPRLLVWAGLLLAVFALLGLLVVHVLAHDAVGRADLRVDRSLAQDRTPTWNTVTHVVTDLAETPTVVIAGAVLVLLVLPFLTRRARPSLFLAAVLVGEVTIFVVTTFLVHRPRPPVPHLDAAPPTSSFPSGHTAAAVALYGGVAVLASRHARRALVRVLTGVLALLVPVAVALSRLYRGMHFPSDVVAGAMLGLSWLAVVARLVPTSMAARLGRRGVP